MRLPNTAVHAALNALASGGPNRTVGLSTTPITVTTTGLSGVTEPAAASYARVSLPAASWSSAADRAVQAAQVMFPAPTQDWGVIVAYFVTTAAGVPEIPFSIDDPLDVPAGSSAPKVTPRISAPLN